MHLILIHKSIIVWLYLPELYCAGAAHVWLTGGMRAIYQMPIHLILLTLLIHLIHLIHLILLILLIHLIHLILLILLTLLILLKQLIHPTNLITPSFPPPPHALYLVLRCSAVAWPDS